MALGIAGWQRRGDLVTTLVGMMVFEIEQGALVLASLLVAGQVPTTTNVRVRDDQLHGVTIVLDYREAAPAPDFDAAAHEKTGISIVYSANVDAAIVGGEQKKERRHRRRRQCVVHCST